MVSCINLQRPIPEKQIISLVFDESITILLKSLRKSYHSWSFKSLVIVEAENILAF